MENFLGAQAVSFRRSTCQYIQAKHLRPLPRLFFPFHKTIVGFSLDFHKRRISIVRKVFFVKKANNAQNNAFLGQNLAIRQLAGGLFRVLDATDGIPIIFEEARFAPIIVVIDQYYADCIFAVATDIGRIDNNPLFTYIYSEQMCN